MCECPLRYESFRLKTFEKNWNNLFLRKDILARSGFYFIGPRDRVKCFFCEIQVEKWMPGEDEIAEHKKWSPQCPQLKNMSTCNIPLRVLTEIDQTVGQDVCGSCDMNTHMTNTQQFNEEQTFFLSESKIIAFVFDKKRNNDEFRLQNRKTEDFIILNKHILEEEIIYIAKELLRVNIQHPTFQLRVNKHVQIYQTDIDSYKFKINNNHIVLTEKDLFSLIDIEKSLNFIYINYF